MTLEHLKKLLEESSDEIPHKVLHGKGNYKVRRNWWQGVIADLEILDGKGMISNELRDEVGGFLDHYTSEAFHRQQLTKKEDIDKANNLIGRIIGKK